MHPQVSLHALSVLIAGTFALFGFNLASAATNIYSTQFETAEGYVSASDLAGQLGWIGEGTGGNGLTEEFIAGQGQHAYVGFTAPTSASEDQLVVWQPINFNPQAASLPIVIFSVQMQIADSANQNWDNFRWSIYNIQGNRLFSLDFDNYELAVNYLLDGTNLLTGTGLQFTNEVTYQLTVTMNFASNLWSATLGDRLIATNQPITTTNAPLNLGDVDAVWLIFSAATPGDNFMVFDNYQIAAAAVEGPRPPPAQMQLLSRTAEGWALLRVFGQANSRWAVEATTNFTLWSALRTNTISGDSFDHVDTTAAGLSGRFYRARFVP